MNMAHEMGIETRPICAGNVLRQTPFKYTYRPKFFQNSEHIHNNGFYVGLHGLLSPEQVVEFANNLSANIMPLKFGGQ